MGVSRDRVFITHDLRGFLLQKEKCLYARSSQKKAKRDNKHGPHCPRGRGARISFLSLWSGSLPRGMDAYLGIGDRSMSPISRITPCSWDLFYYYSYTIQYLP